MIDGKRTTSLLLHTLGLISAVVMLNVLLLWSAVVVTFHLFDVQLHHVLELLALLAMIAAVAIGHMRVVMEGLDQLVARWPTTKKEAEQFGGDPLPDPIIDVSSIEFHGSAFIGPAPHPHLIYFPMHHEWRFVEGTTMRRSELERIRAQAKYMMLRKNAAQDSRFSTRTTPSPAEALFGFAGWLSTRPQTLEVGATRDAARLAMLVGMYIEAQGFAPTRDGWEKWLEPMGNRDIRFEEPRGAIPEEFQELRYQQETSFGVTPGPKRLHEVIAAAAAGDERAARTLGSLGIDTERDSKVHIERFMGVAVDELGAELEDDETDVPPVQACPTCGHEYVTQPPTGQRVKTFCPGPCGSRRVIDGKGRAWEIQYRRLVPYFDVAVVRAGTDEVAPYGLQPANVPPEYFVPTINRAPGWPRPFEVGPLSIDAQEADMLSMESVDVKLTTPPESEG